MSRVLMMGVVMVVVGAATTSWAVSELRYGVIEIPMHWWSSAAAVPLAIGALLTGWGLRQRTRSADPR